MSSRLYIIFLLLISFNQCFAPALSITSGGLYTLGEDIIFSPGVSDSAISIQASNVTLNLNGRVVSQGDSTAAVNGISISAGVNNVTIINGTLRGFTNCGITHSGASSSNFAISGIQLANCQNRGISIIGAGGSPIQGVTINNCTFTNCSEGSSADSIFHCELISSGNIKNIFINKSTFLGGGTRHAIRCITTTETLFDSILIGALDTNGVSAPTTVTAVSIESTSVKNIFSNITIERITNSLGSIQIMAIDNSSGQSIITNLKATSGTAGAGTARGLVFSGVNTAPWVVSGCIIQQLSATSTCTPYSLTSLTDTILTDCIANRCSSSGTLITLDGFLFSGCTRCHAIRCSATNSTTTGFQSLTNGFRFDTGSLACSATESLAAGNTAPISTGSIATGFIVNNSSSCCLRRNSAYQNTALLSRGFTLSGTGTNTHALMQNMALQNGASSVAQFSGLGVSQLNTQANTSSNSLNQPWTNVGLSQNA